MGIVKKIKSYVKSVLGIDHGPGVDDLVAMGMKVGKNFFPNTGAFFDNSHCWLIEIGDDVTFGPFVYILAHDASTKRELGYTKIGKVVIGDRAFIGARTIVMPNVKIGSDCIIGAGSVVTHDVPDGSVYAGNPARLICTVDEYYSKQKALMENNPCYDYSYTIKGNISDEKKQQMIKELESNIGFVI